MNNFWLLSNFIANFKMAYKLSNRSFICRYNKWLLKIIDYMFETNLILNYNIINNSFVLIKVKYYSNNKRPLFRDISVISKSSNKIYTKHKKLKFYTKKYDLILLSDSQGFYFINKKFNKLKKYKKGGLLIFGLIF